MAAYVGMTFAGIYAVFVLLVYFAQTTSVRFEELDGVALRILDYSQGGLFFSYDLLGYGMMAVSYTHLDVYKRQMMRMQPFIREQIIRY